MLVYHNMYTLHVKPTETVSKYYVNHKAAFDGDSGIDLFFAEDCVCNPSATTMIDLEISCMMTDDNGNPKSYYLYPRSSISKTPLMLHNSVGIIDAGYRASIKVALRNVSNTAYFIKKGDRLVQICDASLAPIVVKVTNELPETGRGAGFGSSGVSGAL